MAVRIVQKAKWTDAPDHEDTRIERDRGVRTEGRRNARGSRWKRFKERCGQQKRLEKERRGGDYRGSRAHREGLIWGLGGEGSCEDGCCSWPRQPASECGRCRGLTGPASARAAALPLWPQRCATRWPGGRVPAPRHPGCSPPQTGCSCMRRPFKVAGGRR